MFTILYSYYFTYYYPGLLSLSYVNLCLLVLTYVYRSVLVFTRLFLFSYA